MKLKHITLLLFAAGVLATVDLPPLAPLIVSLLLDMIGAKQANVTVAMSQLGEATTVSTATATGTTSDTTATFSRSTLSASYTST